MTAKPKCYATIARYVLLNALHFVTKVKNHLLTWKSDAAVRRLYTYLNGKCRILRSNGLNILVS